MMTFEEFQDTSFDCGVMVFDQRSNKQIIHGCLTVKEPAVFYWRIKDRPINPNDCSKDHVYYVNMYEPKLEVDVSENGYVITKEDLEDLMINLNSGTWQDIINACKQELEDDYPDDLEMKSVLDKIPSTPPNYMELLNNQ